MFAAISDNVTGYLIAGAVALYIEWSRRNTAKKVAGVKDDLAKTHREASASAAVADKANAAKLDDIGRTARSVHYLVNSSMLKQMEVSYKALERLAVIAEQSKLITAPADRIAADDSKKLYEDHKAKQMALDALPGPAGR